ncbi:MAG: hypothetical protein ATN34_01425 [Epulopiscium sp. Nele67-Bin002]|nr:MAG: hypothetical protein BEN18_01170 [Epulopiscium sp. Nuni2H_MBin001]OON92357.1 MAG: hypothetical protein ATN33_07505 [Epulopiscium sp. Nele67-Bin001]OON92692.1 MAG: hypothetical protein ATN34_01425 [Epulopiscium sp. Nele67-Bin002]
MNATEIDLEKVRVTAEGYYQRRDFSCSEAIMKTVKDEFQMAISDDLIKATSGLGAGIGMSGCVCGALSGGCVVLGLVFGRSVPKDPQVATARRLTNELHDIFRDHHKTTCCRIHLKKVEYGGPEHIAQCAYFTGDMAYEVAKIICRELEIKTI